MITVGEFYTTLMNEYNEDKLTVEEFDKIADMAIVPRGLVEEVLNALELDIKSYKDCEDDYIKGIRSACVFYKNYIEGLLKILEEEGTGEE